MSEPEFMIGMVLGATLMGAGMGLFPLIIGLIFERTSLAIVGFVATLIAGFILGIIAALPVSLGFTVYIAAKVRDERKRKIADIYDL